MRRIATITIILFSACGVVDSDDNSTVVIGPDSATGGDIQLNDRGADPLGRRRTFKRSST